MIAWKLYVSVPDDPAFGRVLTNANLLAARPCGRMELLTKKPPEHTLHMHPGSKISSAACYDKMAPVFTNWQHQCSSLTLPVHFHSVTVAY